MANFESGVAAYVHAQAVIDVFFPIDAKGNADISCRQCYYFQESANRCRLNWEVCAYPNRFVGASCPLYQVDENGVIIENKKENDHD